MRFYTTQKLGPKRELTPEGFLLCLDVPVARTGEMLYGIGEVPLDPGLDGLIRVSRNAEDLFRSETLASCMGKPATLDHPEEFVTPATYASLSKGSMLNVRRGDGADNDLMIADLLITEAEAIKAVQNDGIEEVSLGYEADYEQVSPGRGVQRNIVVNHVALVERGRCGPRCAIGDKEMAKKTKLSFADRLRKAFMSKDADEAEKLAKEAEDAASEEEEEEGKPDGKTGDALTKILAKLQSMDADIQELKKAAAEDSEEEEEEEPTNDDILNAETAGKVEAEGVMLYTGDAARLIAERAEILAPGTKLPTFDSKTTDAARASALCKCQRKALDVAYQTDAGKNAIKPFLGSMTADFAKLPVAVVHSIFTGAAEMLRAANNGATTNVAVSTRDFGKPTSVAELNARHKAYWADRGSNH